MRLTRASLVFLFSGTIILAEAQQYVISTYAGGVPPPTPATGINLSIGYPQAIAVDTAGNAYFIALNCVFKLDQNGMVTRIAGNSLVGYTGDGGPAISAQLQLRSTNIDRLYISNLPPGITVDKTGNVYVADNGNSRIRRISPDGIIATVAGNGTFGFSGDGGPATSAQLSNVLGMAVDTAGNLLIADADNNRVRLVSQDGIIISVAGDGSCAFSGDGGPAASAQLCAPAGMVTDNAGNVLFADTRNNRIRRISPDGTITTAAGSGLWQPTSVGVDGAGNLFIANTDADGFDAWQVVKKLFPGGSMATGAGCTPSYPLRFDCMGNGTTGTRTFLDGPISLAVNSAGSVLILEPVIAPIRKLLPDGSLVNLAGNGEYEFSGDGGPATSAQLGPPAGLAVDNSGNLFIADYFNARVRKVSPERTITTVAGNGDQIYPPASSGDGGPATSAQVSEPVGVAVDGAGNLVIATLRGLIKKVSPDGIITTVAGGGSFGYMTALAADSDGNLFIGGQNSSHPPDQQVGGIVKVSPDGTIRTGIVTDAMVLGVALDNVGNLFFTEGSPGSRVRRLSPDGSVLTVAGNGTAGFSGDGGPATMPKWQHQV